MALDTEKAAIDTAFGTLSTAMTTYIAAGGQAGVLAKWLAVRTAMVTGFDEHRRAAETINQTKSGYRGTAFADVAER